MMVLEALVLWTVNCHGHTSSLQHELHDEILSQWLMEFG